MTTTNGQVELADGASASVILHHLLLNAVQFFPETLAAANIPASSAEFRKRYVDILPRFELARLTVTSDKPSLQTWPKGSSSRFAGGRRQTASHCRSISPRTPPAWHWYHTGVTAVPAGNRILFIEASAGSTRHWMNWRTA